jgi:hypothetical protein
MGAIARRVWLLRICMLAVIGLPAATCAAATYEWTNPVNGTYSTAGNWTLTSGSGTPPPVAGDTALLNEVGTYTVTFSANAASDVLSDTAGTVTFASNTSTVRTYSLTTGTADASITGSSTVLNVGNIGNNPMALSVGDNLTVNSGGTLNVRTGNSVSTFDLVLGTAGSGITSTIVVEGAFTRTNTSTTTIIGQNGATGVLTFRNGASGDINGTLTVTSSGFDTTAANLNVQSGATLDLDTLNIGAGVSTVAHGDVTVTGSGSAISQTTGSTLTIGTASGNIGTLNISSSGTFNTIAGGMMTVNKTGTVTIGSGSSAGALNAKGNVTIDGGVIDRQSGSFNLATGQTMNIQNGGRFTSNSYTTATSAVYNIIGANSKLEITSGNLTIDDASHVNVSAGGRVTSAGGLNVGNGTLSVTDSGSRASAVDTSTWGLGGKTATVHFSNAAIGTFGDVDLARSTTANTMANVTIDSGALLSTNLLTMAELGGATTSATLTIDGSGSVLAINGDMTLGNASTGTATITVTNGGSLDVGIGGHTTLNTTGTININGGTADLGFLTDNGGTINLTAGSLSYLGDLTIGTGGLLGTSLTLTSNRTLTLTGTTRVDVGQRLNLSGGSLSTGSLVNDGIISFTSGTLAITGAGGLVIGNGGPLTSLTLGSTRTLNVTQTTTITTGGSLTLSSGGTFATASLELSGGTLTIQDTGRTINVPISGDAASTMNISATNVVLGTAASFNGFHYDGVLNVGPRVLTLNSAGYARLGVLTSLAGGTINATNGVTFASGSNFLGNGTVSARVTGELGSVIEANGALALGDLASPAGFNFAGELHTKQFAVTLNTSGLATLGNLTTLGSGAAVGTLNATNGFFVDFGNAVTGFGTVNSTNSLAKRSIVNGAVEGTSAAQPITLTGWIKGLGSFNNASFTGTFDPGLSTTITSAGNLALTSTSALIMELGGTTPGSAHDQINASGTLALGGTLNVSLVNGFSPTAGNTFDILNWSTLTGTFSTIQLPSLAAGLSWSTSQLYSTGVLSVVPGITGDYNANGTVDAADYIVWRKTLGQTGTGLAADGNNNSQIDQADFDIWRSHFGQTAGSGSAATDGSSTTAQAVPEPTCLALLISAVLIVRGYVQHQLRFPEL